LRSRSREGCRCGAWLEVWPQVSKWMSCGEADVGNDVGTTAARTCCV